MPYLKHCIVCGKLFVARNNMQLCCSAECSCERAKTVRKQYEKSRPKGVHKHPKNEIATAAKPTTQSKAVETNPILRRLAKGLPPHEECHQCVYWKSITGGDERLDSNKMCYFAQINPYCRKRSEDKKHCLSVVKKGENINDNAKLRKSTDDD